MSSAQNSCYATMAYSGPFHGIHAPMIYVRVPLGTEMKTNERASTNGGVISRFFSWSEISAHSEQRSSVSRSVGLTCSQGCGGAGKPILLTFVYITFCSFHEGFLITCQMLGMVLAVGNARMKRIPTSKELIAWWGDSQETHN